MNILNFINSHDIRAHLEKIGFVPNALESAWLIYQSNNHTIEEKHAAWRWIISNMPDCEVNGKWIESPQKSLHKFLSRYMEIEDYLIMRFFIPEEGAVYTYRALLENELEKYDDRSEWYKSNSIFSTFEEAFADATEDNELAPLFLEFEKKHLGAHGRSIRVRMTPDKKPVFIDEELMLANEEEADIYYNIFFYLHFDFPHPFKKGDIICCPAKVKYKNPKAWDATFVIGEDSEDGTPVGYMAEDEYVYCERIYSYMDFELLQGEGEPRRDRRMLLPISKYLKGEIDLSLLLGACRMITLEIQKNETNSLLSFLPTSLKIV